MRRLQWSFHEQTLHPEMLLWFPITRKLLLFSCFFFRVAVGVGSKRYWERETGSDVFFAAAASPETSVWHKGNKYLSSCAVQCCNIYAFLRPTRRDGMIGGKASGNFANGDQTFGFWTLVLLFSTAPISKHTRKPGADLEILMQAATPKCDSSRLFL